MYHWNKIFKWKQHKEGLIVPGIQSNMAAEAWLLVSKTDGSIVDLGSQTKKDRREHSC